LKRPLRGKSKKTSTLLVDGSALLKTAYHGAKQMFYKENHIGGLFQFFTTLRKILNENSIDRVYIFWDGEFSGRLRYEIYKDYKKSREKDFYNSTDPSNPELYIQRERVKQYAEELFIRQYTDDIIEADDAIGYYCQTHKDEDIIILTRDGDFCQLISDNISVYLLNKKVKITESNYLNYFEHHPKNSLLVKIISGDSSDDIVGVRGVKEKTLLKYFPEIGKKELTLTEIFDKIEVIQNQRKTRLKTLDNILNGVTVGPQKEKLYEINQRLMDLKNPILTEESKENIDVLSESPLDPEGRSNKNLLSMMIDDGFIYAIPGGREGYVEYLRPFLGIIKKEKKFFEQTN
jgi:DNA polymerase-1